MPRTAIAADARVAAPARARKDVARLAGVSTATVSRVLNTPEQVDADTRQLVRDAVAKLRYVPHGAARALRSHRSQMVGAVVPSFDYALYARTTSALQARARRAAATALVLAEHHYDLAAELRITEQLISHGVDAFVFVGLDHDPALFALLESYGRPYVLTWGVDPMRRHPSIGFDNRAATFEMTRHLIALGHRRFGLLSAPTEGNDRATRARRRRARGAGAGRAWRSTDAASQYGPIDLARRGGDDARLLALPRARPTAVVAHQRRVRRRRAWSRAAQAGVRIPDDISITGVRQHRPRRDADAGADQHPHADRRDRPGRRRAGDRAARRAAVRRRSRPLPFELVRARQHRGPRPAARADALRRFSSRCRTSPLQAAAGLERHGPCRHAAGQQNLPRPGAFAMELDELNGRYRHLRSELDAAYSEPVWDSSRINRITEELVPVELALASFQFEPNVDGASHV